MLTSEQKKMAIFSIVFFLTIVAIGVTVVYVFGDKPLEIMTESNVIETSVDENESAD